METVHNRNYDGITMGEAIRRQVAHTWIFRVRHGNGHYTSILGAEYQDKYAYVVPSSINNPEGQAARDALAIAVSNWQAFSDEAKQTYKDKAAALHLRMSGYNLYIKEYVRANA